MYAEFVEKIDPSGYVIDYLFQCQVFEMDTKERVCAKETRGKRCDAMLRELFSTGKPKAFVELREALKHNYQYIVDIIDEATTTV